MISSYHVRKTQLVELVVAGISGGNTQTNFQFTPQTYLQGKRMSSLEIYAAHECPNSPISGNLLVPAANVNNAFLTLYFADPDNNNASGQFIQYRLLWLFHRINNGTDPYVWHLPVMDGQVVTWEKSFVTMAAAPGNTVNWSFLFDVGYYDDPNANS